MEAIDFLAAPLVMCFLLVGIHCYLGLHVLEREVIFVDLALAQVAAFGSLLSLFLGLGHSSVFTYLLSLAATFVAALFLALSNQYKARMSQEAVIGILYAFASASLILIADKISHGEEHIKHALVGQLLWVTWSDVIKVFGIYSVVALIHFIFRKPFLENSFSKTLSWKWDFLFYALFGLVITSSVHVSGVLLVFSFLIVPAVLSSIFYRSLLKRLFFGWGVGFLLSALGVFFSYSLDFPTGACIVALFTLLPILTVLGMKVFRISKRHGLE